MIKSLFAASSASCAFALAMCLGGCSGAAGGVASNDRGSIAVDGNQLTITLNDDANDGYSWSSSVAQGIQLSSLDVNSDGAKCVLVYGVDANMMADVVIDYVNDDAMSDVMYEEKLHVETDDKGNVTTAELIDADGTSATVKR